MDASHNSQFEQPERVVEKAELARMLEKALDKEKSVVLFYYYEDLSLKEISRVLEVSESRVSQLHTKAIQKMKKHLGGYMGLLSDQI
jgi:RNA polymerase sigma factor for flagellar operon FliA